MRSWIRNILCIGLCLLAAVADAESGDDDDIGKEKQQIYNLYADVDLVPTTKIEYGKPRIVAKLLYPKLDSETHDDNIDLFNQLVSNLSLSEYTSFKKQVDANQAARANIPASQVRNDLTMDFDTSVINTDGDNPLISIRFSITGYITGAARPFHYHRTLNYALSDGQALELADLFQPDSNYLNVLAEYTNQTLSRRLKDKQRLSDGAAPNPDNFKNWNVNAYGLVITFDRDQVAPTVLGTQTVFIPYSVLADIAAPDSIIAICAAHRKRCLRKNILTGGFIDQALQVRHGVFDPQLSKA